MAKRQYEEDNCQEREVFVFGWSVFVQQIVISPLPKSLRKLRKAISPLIDLSTAPSLGLEGIENIAPYFLVRIPECRVGLV